MISIAKRPGEERFFSGAFAVFRCISAFFSCVLFGGIWFFRIFAHSKGRLYLKSSEIQRIILNQTRQGISM